MNHRETIRGRRTRATQKQRGVMGKIRPMIQDCPQQAGYMPGQRVTLKIENCAPAGIKMFCYRDQVAPMVSDANHIILTNGMMFRTEDIDKLFKKAGVKQEQLKAPVSLWR